MSWLFDSDLLGNGQTRWCVLSFSRSATTTLTKTKLFQYANTIYGGFNEAPYTRRNEVDSCYKHTRYRHTRVIGTHIMCTNFSPVIGSSTIWAHKMADCAYLTSWILLTCHTWLGLKFRLESRVRLRLWIHPAKTHGWCMKWSRLIIFSKRPHTKTFMKWITSYQLGYIGCETNSKLYHSNQNMKQISRRVLFWAIVDQVRLCAGCGLPHHTWVTPAQRDRIGFLIFVSAKGAW